MRSCHRSTCNTVQKGIVQNSTGLPIEPGGWQQAAGCTEDQASGDLFYVASKLQFSRQVSAVLLYDDLIISVFLAWFTLRSLSAIVLSVCTNLGESSLLAQQTFCTC